MSAAVKWQCDNFSRGRPLPVASSGTALPRARGRTPQGLSTMGHSVLGAPIHRALPTGPPARRGPVVDNPTAADARRGAVAEPGWRPGVRSQQTMREASTDRNGTSVVAMAKECGPASEGRHRSGCLAPPSIRVGVVLITVHQILYSLGAEPRGHTLHLRTGSQTAGPGERRAVCPPQRFP